MQMETSQPKVCTLFRDHIWTLHQIFNHFADKTMNEVHSNNLKEPFIH